MKKLVSLVCCILLLGMLCYASGEYSGYIVKLKDECVLPFGSLYSNQEEQVFDSEETAVLLSDEFPEIGVVYSPEGLIKVQDEETLQYLVDMGIVEYSEPDLICELYGYTPEDNPRYSQQWALDAVNAFSAWNVGVFGQGVKVAVIDSGVYAHNDLVANLLPGADYEGITMEDTDAVPGTDTTDNLWHGTFVAGIVAAQCNDIGVVGLSHNVKIVPIKVCDSSKFTISYVIPAIYAAVDDFDCDVINLSLGTLREKVTYVNGEIKSGSIPDHQPLRDAVTYAVNKGCIVVAASGNDGKEQSITKDPETGDVTEIRCYSMPAIFPNVISVGNAELSNNQSESNYDIEVSSTYNEFVNVAAPGTGIVSTSNNGGYSKGKGTSFAAPYVSAAAAIMKSIDPSINFSTFNSLIRSLSDKSVFPSSKNSNYYGAGMLDMEALIDYWLSRKHSNGFLSPIDIQTNEYNSSVYVYNTTASAADYSVVITSDSKSKTLTFSLEAEQTKEISLTELGFVGETQVCLYQGAYQEGVQPITARSAVIPREFILGDLNDDKLVNEEDIEILSMFLAGFDVTLDESAAKCANVYTLDDKSDTNSVLNINIKDLIKLTQDVYKEAS